MILKNCIEKLIVQQRLDSTTCQAAFNELLAKPTNPLHVAAFLVLLRSQPETSEEITSLVNILRRKMIKVPTQHRILDIVGTGGDGANTVNISTGSAILTASCGVKIAKHGNRAVSSMSGAADVLEALGVVIDMPPDKISACIDEVGIGFCFSPNFHPMMRELRAIRKQLNIPTIFNLIGPLLNPANANHFLMGVFNENLLPIVAESLQRMGIQHSLVVHGCGLDELSCVGPAKIIEINKNEITTSVIDPALLGFSRCHISDLRGGNAALNAKLLLEAFSGKKGPISDTLILNTAVALYLYGLYPSVMEALPHAKENLYSGAALVLLNKWIEFTHD